MIRGFDWASYQGDIDAERASRAGYSFAIGKVSEGTSYVNPTYDANYQRVVASGMLPGNYHFFSTDIPGIDQCDYYVEHGHWWAGTLSALDLEDDPNGRPLRHSDRDDVLKWIERHIVLQRFPPLIYSNQDVLNRLAFTQAELQDSGLWLAAYQFIDPTPVPPWTFVAFWQHRTEVPIPGVPGSPTQEDYFNGPVSRLVLYGAR